MNKKIYLIIGSVLVVALLAGGAFMAMRLLNAKTQSSMNPGGKGSNLIMQSQGGPGGGKAQFYAKQIPAPELPKQTIDLRGQVVSVKDNSIFVGQMDKFVMGVKNGVVQQQPTPPGPYTEVVVSKDTKIYRDITMENMPTPSANSSPDNPAEIQQSVELVDVSAITPSSMVQVWGQRRGDRLIAEVMVVTGIGVFKVK
jgi:hypothetical protein